jgi:hypothetical protein
MIDIRLKERPDFDVQLDEGLLYLEHTELVHKIGAQRRSNIKEMERRFRALLEQTPKLKSKLEGQIVSLQIDLYLPARPKYKIDSTVRELGAYLEDTDLNEVYQYYFRTAQQKYPNLASLCATLLLQKGSGYEPQIDIGAMFFDPQRDLDLLKQRIASKGEDAVKYRVRDNLWLLVYDSEMTGSAQDILDLLQCDSISFGPFRGLIVGNEWDLISFLSASD